jgi:hypothetical protein
MTAPEGVDPETGEILDPKTLPEPVTLSEANSQLQRLIEALRSNSTSRTAKRRELHPVNLDYIARYAAARMASQASSSDDRRAEAEAAMFAYYRPDDELCLAERKAQIELELKILTEIGHDIRAAISALQTTSKNLQSEAYASGAEARWSA